MYKINCNLSNYVTSLPVPELNNEYLYVKVIIRVVTTVNKLVIHSKENNKSLQILIFIVFISFQ